MSSINEALQMKSLTFVIDACKILAQARKVRSVASRRITSDEFDAKTNVPHNVTSFYRSCCTEKKARFFSVC